MYEYVNMQEIHPPPGPPVEAENIMHPSPPTKSSGFSGFDSSKLLKLKGGNSHVRIIL